jgi:hypothetical protein
MLEKRRQSALFALSSAERAPPVMPPRTGEGDVATAPGGPTR